MKERERQTKVGQVLAKIVANEYRCALSGWEISPQCFELDHIIAMNDGGTDKIENLQAVHPLVNRAKGTMGNDQFIAMCIAVADFTRNGNSLATKAEVDDVRRMATDYLLATPRES